jgi:hypothetical protein
MSRELPTWLGAAIVIGALGFASPLGWLPFIAAISYVLFHEMFIANKRGRSRRRRRR